MACFPRTRGGDPKRSLLLLSEISFSPHARGVILASAMSKADRLSMLNSNEPVVFFNIMACAMQKIGVL